jgi:uncharacterized protein with HEPN domain
MSEDEFRKDELVQDALIRNFTVIGEAANHVPEDIRFGTPQVPWSSMRGMRNLIVHEYFDIDPKIIWDTVWGELPRLEDQLREILESR